MHVEWRVSIGWKYEGGKEENAEWQGQARDCQQAQVFALMAQGVSPEIVTEISAQKVTLSA